MLLMIDERFDSEDYELKTEKLQRGKSGNSLNCKIFSEGAFGFFG